MSLQERIKLNEEDRRIDEQILNEIRLSEAGFVGTTEISESERVERETDTVRERLKELEEDGRVNKKRIGHPERGNLAWYLPEDSRQEPVNTDIYWAVQVAEGARGIGHNVLIIGAIAALFGVLLMVTGLFAIITDFQLVFLSGGRAAGYGLALSAAGAANVLVGGGMKFGSVISERVLDKRA